MERREVIEGIVEAAKVEGIDPDLFLAICTVESSLNPYALRFEPHYKWLFHPADWGSRFFITAETEAALQKFSVGACQVMGAVMREMGYREHLAHWLENPLVPLAYGARHLKRYLVKYHGEEAAVAAYNAGSARQTSGNMWVNQQYVDKVFKELRKLRAPV